VKSTVILSEGTCNDRVATYFEGLAAGCLEAAATSDFRVWETMAGVLRRVRQTIREIEREEAKAQLGWKREFRPAPRCMPEDTAPMNTSMSSLPTKQPAAGNPEGRCFLAALDRRLEMLR